MGVSILIYSHSEYSFLWSALFSLFSKHVDKAIPVHFLINDSTEKKELEIVPENFVTHTYSESLIWTDRVLKALGEITDSHILFLHEDWLPIGAVTAERLEEVEGFMREKNCGYLLSYSDKVWFDNEHAPTRDPDYEYVKINNHVFQPAIWSRDTFMEFCSVFKVPKNMNENSSCLNFMGERNCWSVQNIDTERYARSVNSFFYPHAHVLARGLWAVGRYPNILAFLEHLQIDHTTRGHDLEWEKDTPEIIPF
jgi:hypothetical protein